MASQKLTHATFWDRMDRATRHVGKLPPWLKGSPSNERSVCGQCQADIAPAGSDATTSVKQNPPPPRQ